MISIKPWKRNVTVEQSRLHTEVCKDHDHSHSKELAGDHRSRLTTDGNSLTKVDHDRSQVKASTVAITSPLAQDTVELSTTVSTATGLAPDLMTLTERDSQQEAVSHSKEKSDVSIIKEVEKPGLSNGGKSELLATHSKNSGYMNSVEHVLKDVSRVYALESVVTHFELGYTGTFDCLAEYK